MYICLHDLNMTERFVIASYYIKIRQFSLESYSTIDYIGL